MSHDPDDAPDTDRMLLIVVGAHLRAEIADRPLAYRLRDAVTAWQRRVDGPALLPVVCSDLWYLNAAELMARPTVAVGRPGHNAVSAYLAGRLPPVLVIDDRLQVQLDPSWAALQACAWGVDGPSNEAAVTLFQQKFLDEFLQRAREA